MNNEIFLSKTLVQELEANNSCGRIIDNNVKKLFTINSKLFVCTASCSSGEKGIHYVKIQECVPINKENENLTLTYIERINLINEGKLELSYYRQKFYYNNRYFMFLNNEITVYPLQETKQLTIF